MTVTVDLAVQQAAGYQAVFVYCAPLAGSNPPAPDVAAPVNVTGWTARFQIRGSVDGPVLVDLTAGAGITVGTTDGKFTVTLSAAQTAALTRDGAYDLLALPPGGQPERVAQGSVLVERAVTLAV